MKKKILIDNKYIRKKLIDTGLTSKVYQVEEIKTKKLYAAKIFKYHNILYDKESEILTELKKKNIPFIVNLIDNGDGDISDGYSFIKKQYLILELAEKKDLSKYITICGKGLKEIHAKLFFSKLLKTVQLIHKSGICHRDLKTSNILLDNKYNPKICDFGFATYIEKNLKEKLGTYQYAAPEIYFSKYDGEKADIFSLGVILFNIVTGTYSFDKAISTDKSYKYIKNKDYNRFWEKLIKIQNVSKDFQKLYEKMISFNPKERPTIDQIMKDNWMKEINDKTEKEINDLELEIYKDFLERENIIEKSTKISHDIISDISSSGLSGDFRGLTNDDNKCYNNDLLPIKMKEGKRFEYYIKIKGKINPVEFMGNFIKKINNESENENEKKEYICESIDINKDKLEFKAFFEVCENDDNSETEDIDEDKEKDLNKELDEENNENNNIMKKDNIIKTKLYELNNSEYLLVFFRLSGEKDDFYKILKILYSYFEQKKDQI